MWSYVTCIWISFLLINHAESARILGVFPIPSRSHQVVFRAYIQELAKRGHELVVITPNPLPKEEQQYNVTEIDISNAYNSVQKLYMDSNFNFKRGVIIDCDMILKYDTYRSFLNIVVEQMNNTSVQKLLKDKSQKFDLIVAEGFYEYHLIVSEIFKAPLILFTSHMGFSYQYEMIGAHSLHPIYYPNFHRDRYGKLGFFEMLKELYYELRLFNHFKNIRQYQDQILKENFGPDAPTGAQLLENVDILLLNTYAHFANNRAIPPNVVYLGATHLKSPKDITGDLKTYLDKSKNGVIYVSFGSNIRPSMMDKDLKNALFKAFEALPYDVLFKFNDDSIENVPKNVKWNKWFPQRDLLFHPNIKAFVTQCGLQSTDEAIDAVVPLVGIPLMAEQWYNAHKYTEFGIGVKLDPLTMTADDLIEGIQTVVQNKSYKENIKRLKRIRSDELQTPLERAVWWTEYTIRHRGAKHLRSPIADATWYEYYMLNILLPVSAVLLVLIIILCYFCKKVLNMVIKNKKIKQN